MCIRDRVDIILEKRNWDLIDLNEYKFSYYDYKHENKDDNYLGLMKLIISNYDTIVFATPVYWYSMSGILKVFFDRLTDLLTIEKDLGRALRGKSMGALSCSTGSHLGDAFWIPFRESANYLGVNYLGSLHTISGKKNIKQVESFIELLERKKK